MTTAVKHLGVSRNIWLAATCTYAALIFYISSLPQPEFPTDLFPWRDKGVHFCEYFALGFFICGTLISTSPVSAKLVRAVVWGALLGWLYGISDEWHQSFVPNRSADVADAYVDGIGSSIGALVCAALQVVFASRRRPNA